MACWKSSTLISKSLVLGIIEDMRNNNLVFNIFACFLLYNSQTTMDMVMVQYIEWMCNIGKVSYEFEQVVFHFYETS